MKLDKETLESRALGSIKSFIRKNGGFVSGPYLYRHMERETDNKTIYNAIGIGIEEKSIILFIGPSTQTFYAVADFVEKVS